MGCSSSKLHGLPAVALCRDRCQSLEETLRRSYALADAHAAYLLSLNTIGPALHRFFDQAVEFPPDVDSETDESPVTSSSESSSSAHSVSSSDPDLPPKFDSELDYLYPNHDHLTPLDHMKSQPSESDLFSRNHDSGTRTPPPPLPSSNYAWDFINFFESYEFPYTMNSKDLKDNETTRCSEEDKSKTQKKKVPMSRNEEKVEIEENNKNLKMSEEKKNTKSEKVSTDFSEITKQLQQMFKRASEAGNDVSKMLDISRFRYYHKNSVYHQGNEFRSGFCAKKMTRMDPKPVGDFRSNISSTLKKLYMWEKKLYQEVKAEEKLRKSHMRNYKHLQRLEQKSTDLSKIEATRSLIQSLSTRIRVSIHKINNICVMINKLRDEELWSQMKELVHRFSVMWNSMLECHSRQSRVIIDAKKLDKMKLKENLDISQLELVIVLKLELRNWSQRLSKWIDAQVDYINALNSWLMRCLKQEPQEPTPDLSEEPPLFGAINNWSQTLDRSDGEKDFTEAVYTILTHINRQVDKQRMEMGEQRNVNGDIERKLRMLEKEEHKMQSKMKTEPYLDLTGNLNLKSDMEQIFKSMEKLARNSKETYEELDLMCT